MTLLQAGFGWLVAAALVLAGVFLLAGLACALIAAGVLVGVAVWLLYDPDVAAGAAGGSKGKPR